MLPVSHKLAARVQVPHFVCVQPFNLSRPYSRFHDVLFKTAKICANGTPLNARADLLLSGAIVKLRSPSPLCFLHGTPGFLSAHVRDRTTVSRCLFRFHPLCLASFLYRV